MHSQNANGIFANAKLRTAHVDTCTETVPPLQATLNQELSTQFFLLRSSAMIKDTRPYLELRRGACKTIAIT